MPGYEVHFRSAFCRSQKEEFIDVSCNNILKSKMDQFCTDFWIESCTEYPVISKVALRVLISFATSYMCVAVFLLWQLQKQNIARSWLLKGKRV